MTDKESRRILRRVGKTIEEANVLLLSLGVQGNDSKKIQSSKSKPKRKKLK